MAIALAPGVAAADAWQHSAAVGSGYPIQGLFRSLPARAVPAGSSNSLPTAPGAICRAALAAAELRHGIPHGLLQAIGLVESGRPAGGASQPWPWTVNAEGEPHVFDGMAAAVDWVRRAQARGVRSIDVGCAQVNLMHHPDAFASLEQAFEPFANADYAARFLRALHAATAGGDWMRAVGLYHSQTPELAADYRQRVAAVAGRGGGFAAAAVRSPFGLPHPAPPAAVPRVLRQAQPSPGASQGRGLAAYRAAPIFAVRVHAPRAGEP